MYSMRACSQRDIGSAIDQDFAPRCAGEGYDTASQFVQGAVGQILLAYLYEVNAPVKNSLDACNEGNSG